MLVGVAPLPSSLIPTLWNIGILYYKSAKLRKDIQHSVHTFLHSSRSPMQCSSWTGRPACGRVPVRHCTDFLFSTHNFLCNFKTPGGKDQSVVDTGSRHPHS